MLIADLHIHSPYAQSTSQKLQIEQIAIWAKRKGVHVISTGDFLHPIWSAELQAKLIPAEDGLFQLQPAIEKAVDRALPRKCKSMLRFMLGVEIGTIYEQNSQVRKLHHLLYAPDFTCAERLRRELLSFGDLDSDGRPVLCINSRDLLELILSISPRCHLIPSHVWNPTCSLFGAMYGFDHLDECFGDLSNQIFAIETGLYSDPTMNRRLSELDHLSLLSFSNAYSPEHIGRKATLFPISPTYDAFFEAMRHTKTAQHIETIEFPPECQPYYLDGHRSCESKFTPEQTLAHHTRCPICHKPLTIGVLHRIEQLADRPASYTHTHPHSHKLIPLTDILCEILEVNPRSQRLFRTYIDLINQFGSELYILRELPIEELRRSHIPLLSEAIQRVRSDNLHITYGYDGEDGKVHIFEDDESKDTSLYLFDLPSPQKARNPSFLTTPRPSSASNLPKQLNLFLTLTSTPNSSSLNRRIPLSTSTSMSELADSTHIDNTLETTYIATIPNRRPLPSPPSEILSLQQDSPPLSIPQSPVQAKMEDEFAQSEGVEQPLHSKIEPPSPQKARSSAVMFAKNLLAGLNTEQRSAVMHWGSPILIAAGSGTGKTKTLAHRVAYNISALRVQPQHIVVLAFTSDAASDLEVKISQLLTQKAQKIFIGTFYSFCLELLREHSATQEPYCAAQCDEISHRLNWFLPDSLLGAFERLAVLEEIALSHNFAGRPRKMLYYLDRISWAKQNLLTPEDCSNLHTYEGDDDFLALYRNYQHYLRQNNRLDLDDLLFQTVDLLRKNRELCQQLQLRFRSFVIDEYQELNEAQYQLLRFIVSDVADLCVAGDPDQAIYGHRGSHTRYFHQFVRDFSRPKQQAIRHALWRNYRSPESILCFSHNLISKQPDPQRIQAVATITGANRISIKAHDDPHTEAIGIAQQIIEYVSADHLAHTALNQESTATTAKTDTGYTGLTTEAQHKLSQIAIIYRSRQQLPYIESALQQARLPYHLTKPGSITSHPDLQLILAFLRQAIPPHCEELSLSIILQYWPTIQHETALEFRKFQELHPLNPQALRIFAQQTPMLQSQRDEIYQICNLIEQLRNRVHPNTHIRPIIEWLNNQLTMLLPVEMLTPDSAISSLLFHADLASRPDQFLQHLLLEHAPVSPTQIPNQITILPIYASKNRQFPVVIIPGCEEGLWPWQESLHDPKALAEERKLFYVACTRCQQQLWITSANTRLLLDQEQKMKPSRYL